MRRRVAAGLPAMGHDTELVLYRVAQEGLTNVARHAGAREAALVLDRTPGGVELRITDDGRGIDGAPEGSGIHGMRERTLLVGADLTVGPGPAGGTEVRLSVPLRDDDGSP